MKNRESFWRCRCVIITGASSGIGRALAEHLAMRGARLGLVARRAELLDELASRIGTAAAAVAVAPADVTDASQIRAAVARLEQPLGPCDVMIANAGIHRYTPGRDFDADSANAVIATNVQGVINTLGAVLPGMLARGTGHLAAVASMAAMLGLPEVGAYSASKAAVVTLLESLRVDLARSGVKVTAICPGFIDTPMIRGHRWQVFIMQPSEAARRIARAIERGRDQCWFPWQMWLAARFARTLPRCLYHRWAARLSRHGQGDQH